MSNPRENVELIQSLYRSFENRDIPGILPLLSPTVEWGEPSSPHYPSAGTRHGHEGFLEWARVGNESEEVLVLELRDFLTSSDSVAVVGYTRCRARTTNKEYETEFVHVFTIQDGKVERFREFFDTYAVTKAFQK